MHRMLIDGKLVPAEADRTYPSVNPATGQVLDHAPDASPADAQAAIAAARRAFDTTSWSTDAAFRARCLDQLHQALTEHKEELRELTIADVGAPRVITYGAQLDEPIEIARYYADLLPGGAQGRAGHPADHARAWRADRVAHGHSAGCRQRDLLLVGRGRRGAHHLARRGRGDVHRLDRHP